MPRKSLLHLCCQYLLHLLHLVVHLQVLWDRLRLWGQYNLWHLVGLHWALWALLTLCCQLHLQDRHWALWDLEVLLHHLPRA